MAVKKNVVTLTLGDGKKLKFMRFIVQKKIELCSKISANNKVRN